jgi:hypothetical protein
VTGTAQLGERQPLQVRRTICGRVPTYPQAVGEQQGYDAVNLEGDLKAWDTAGRGDRPGHLTISRVGDPGRRARPEVAGVAAFSAR